MSIIFVYPWFASLVAAWLLRIPLWQYTNISWFRSGSSCGGMLWIVSFGMFIAFLMCEVLYSSGVRTSMIL